MTTASITPKAARSRSTMLVRIGLGLFVTAMLALVGAMLTIAFGSVHGIEFCPQTFERRSYSFYEIPWLGIQVRGVRHADLTGPVEKHLKQNKLLPTPPKSPFTWHIVAGMRGASPLQTGDAQILVRYLDARDAEEKHVWLDWSQKHPQAAAILWPAIARLSRDELYIFVPEFIDLAKHSPTPAALQQQVDARLVERLYQIAQRYQQADNHPAAIRCLDEAIALDDQRPDLRAARIKSVAAEAK